CGYVNNRVYQNVAGSNNYIGYMRDEGRFSYGDIIIDPNGIDATFIVVESYTYKIGDPRPKPQIVSHYIHHRGITVPIERYIASEQDLWNAYYLNLTVIKAGRTTGYEWGLIRLCNVNPRQVACFTETGVGRFIGWYFQTTAYGAPGDSGGPHYAFVQRSPLSAELVVQVYGISVAVARYSGIQFGEVTSNCIIDNGVGLCMPTFVAILYNITQYLNVKPYSGG
ncbi:MAG: hypothetical protein ACP5I7_07900, partial [Sulfolobales archaeon]